MAKVWHCFYDRITSSSARVLSLCDFLLFILALGYSGCAVQPDTQAKPPLPLAQPAARPAIPAPVLAVVPVQKIQDLAVREERGQTILLIKFSQPLSNYRHFPLPNPARIVLDIFAEAKQPGPSETYRIDTSAVATLRVNQLEGGLRLTTDIAAANVPAYSISQDNGVLRVVVGAENPSATAKKDVVVVSGGVRADVRSQDSLRAGKTSGADKSPGDKKEYTGQKISLEFKDADIKNVFRLLGEVSGKNIVVTDDVNRKVTIRLIEVPWDQAMDLIIDTNGLGKDENGNIVRISTAGRLKAERDVLSAAKKSEENLEDLQTAYLTVNYAKVVKGPNDTNTDKDLVEKAKALLSPRGKIEADQRTNTLIVRDIRAGIDDVQRLIARLDTRTPQVLIESNLIETTPTFSRALGAEVDFRIGNSGARVDSRFLAGSPYTGSLTSVDPSIATTLNEGLRFGLFQNRFGPFRDLNYALSAAEKEGTVKIISRPSVVTLNNVESTIESARIIRIRTTAATVGEAGSLREIRAGINLKVTPQVSADGFVLLNINVKSSTLDFGSQIENIPAENTREAKANVLVRDGETVVIGGILKDTNSDSTTGVPYLKEIPVLGWLFKKMSWQKDFEELVVFITPRIVAAGSVNLPLADQIWREQMKQTDGTVPPVTSLIP